MNIRLLYLLSFTLLIVASTSLYQNIELTFQNQRFSYYFYANIGTPPQKQALTLDTQSSNLFLKCDNCSNCASTIHNFDTKSSSSLLSTQCIGHESICDTCSADNTCDISQDYDFGLGKVHFFGSMNQDVLSFGGSEDKNITQIDQNEPFSANLVCASYTDDSNKNFVGNGVLGVAPHTNKNILFKEFKDQQATFSVCLEGKNGGYLEIGQNPNGKGNFDTFIHYSKETLSAYEITGLQSMSFDETRITDSSDLSKSKVTISTLSQFITLPKSQFEKIVESVNQICKANEASCKPFSAKTQFPACYHIDLSNLNYQSRSEYLYDVFKPSLWLFIDQSYYMLSSFEYFLWAKTKNNGGGLACLALKPSDKNEYILGQPFLFWNRMTFLLDQHKIGVKKYTNCSYNSDSSTYVTLKSGSGIIKYLIYLLLVVAIVAAVHFTNRCQKIRELVGKNRKKPVEFVEELGEKYQSSQNV